MKFGYLAEEISKQSVEGAAWLLLNAYSKIQEERNDLKTKWLTKRQTDLKTWKTLSFKEHRKLAPLFPWPPDALNSFLPRPPTPIPNLSFLTSLICV